MSQYPPQPPVPPPGPPFQYYQPQYASAPYGTPPRSSSACRTAAIVQIILGGLIFLLAFCLAAVYAMLVGGALPAEQQVEMDRLTQDIGIPLQHFLLAASICMAIPSLIFMILAIFVWRTSRVAIVISLVVTALLCLVNLAGVVHSLLTQQGGSVCSNGVFSVLLMAHIGLLIWAWRDAGRIRNPVADIQAQWQQYYAAQAQAQQQNIPYPPPAPPASPGDPNQLPPPPAPPDPRQ